MTTEQFKKLEKYEDNLRKALRFSFVRGLTSGDMQQIADIYFELTGIRKKVNHSCASCRVELLKRVGKLYFDYKNEKTKELIDKKEESQSKTPEEAKEEVNPPKKTTTKKTTKSKTPEE